MGRRRPIIVEGMTPAKHALGGDRRTVEVESGRTAKAERGEGGVSVGRSARKSRSTTRLAETFSMEIYIGEVREGLETGCPEIEAIGKLTEDLRSAGIVVPLQAFAETGERDAARS